MADEVGCSRVFGLGVSAGARAIMESAKAGPHVLSAGFGQYCYRLGCLGDRHVCHVSRGSLQLGRMGRWVGFPVGHRRGAFAELVGVEVAAVVFGGPEPPGLFVGQSHGRFAPPASFSLRPIGTLEGYEGTPRPGVPRRRRECRPRVALVGPASFAAAALGGLRCGARFAPCGNVFRLGGWRL